MKKLFVLLFAASAAFSSLTASAQTWTADKSHSKLGFSITHMMVSDVEGAFKTFESTIVSSKPDFSDAVISLTADVNSVNTDDDKRDGHLKSADFFDAEKYPKLTFKSTSIKKVAAGKYKVTGQLNLHGVTKVVVLDAVLRGTTVNQSKKTVAGFKVTGTIRRADYALGTKYPNAMLSDEIALNANTEFVQN
jgi:polyisoprenoid-binding protein YceI